MARSPVISDAKILDCIDRLRVSQGKNPTIVEIGECCGIKSQGAVWARVRQLAQKGKLTYIPNTHRTIEVVHDYI